VRHADKKVRIEVVHPAIAHGHTPGTGVIARHVPPPADRVFPPSPHSHPKALRNFWSLI